MRYGAPHVCKRRSIYSNRRSSRRQPDFKTRKKNIDHSPHTIVLDDLLHLLQSADRRTGQQRNHSTGPPAGRRIPFADQHHVDCHRWQFTIRSPWRTQHDACRTRQHLPLLATDAVEFARGCCMPLWLFGPECESSFGIIWAAQGHAGGRGILRRFRHFHEARRDPDKRAQSIRYALAATSPPPTLRKCRPRYRPRKSTASWGNVRLHRTPVEASPPNDSFLSPRSDGQPVGQATSGNRPVLLHEPTPRHGRFPTAFHPV